MLPSISNTPPSVPSSSSLSKPSHLHTTSHSSNHFSHFPWSHQPRLQKATAKIWFPSTQQLSPQTPRTTLAQLWPLSLHLHTNSSLLSPFPLVYLSSSLPTPIPSMGPCQMPSLGQQSTYTTYSPCLSTPLSNLNKNKHVIKGRHLFY